MHHDHATDRRSFLKVLMALPLGAILTGASRSGSSTTFELDGMEELKEVGGSVLIKDVTIGKTTTNLIIVRKSETDYVVFSAVCTHKKCNVRFKNDLNAFKCPCHGSLYDIDGVVQNGPAPANLTRFKSEIQGNKLIVSE